MRPKASSGCLNSKAIQTVQSFPETGSLASNTNLPLAVLADRIRKVQDRTYPSVFKIQQEQLVLVKGGQGSRLLNKAYRISSEGTDRSGNPLKVVSPDMRKVFGDFDGKVSIQRSPPRWVDSAFVGKAIDFVKTLE